MVDRIGELLEERVRRRAAGFDPAAMRDQDLAIVYRATGPEAGSWTIAIEGGTVAVRAGETDRPALTVSASTPDLLASLEGRLNPKIAVLTGRIRVRGDRAVLARLRGLLGGR